MSRDTDKEEVITDTDPAKKTITEIEPGKPQIENLPIEPGPDSWIVQDVEKVRKIDRKSVCPSTTFKLKELRDELDRILQSMP